MQAITKFNEWRCGSTPTDVLEPDDDKGSDADIWEDDGMEGAKGVEDDEDEMEGLTKTAGAGSEMGGWFQHCGFYRARVCVWGRLADPIYLKHGLQGLGDFVLSFPCSYFAAFLTTYKTRYFPTHNMKILVGT